MSEIPEDIPEDVVLVECPACQGAGEWDEGPAPASSGATEPEYRQVFCSHCDGTGRIYEKSEPISVEDLEFAP